MDSKFYKYCIVPECKSTTIKTPKKLFIRVPTKENIRRNWLKLAGREDAHRLSLNSRMYFCEDHFDLETDMENYIKFKLVGGIIKLKNGVVPHKFKCQEKDFEQENCAVQKPESGKSLKNKSNDESWMLEEHEAMFVAFDNEIIEDLPNLEISVCRVCLKTEGEMYKMEENDTLYELYQVLTGLMLSDEERLPRSVCPECCSWLLECERFKSTSLRSHLVLQQILNRHGCITVESLQFINKFHSPVSLDTTDKQTDQCHSHNEAVIKHEDAQTDRQEETVHTPDVNKDIIIDVIKEESDDSNMMPLDIVKIEYDNDDTDKVTDDNDNTEHSVVENVLDLQETTADPLEIENECKNEADVNIQSDNDEMEHGTGFSDEDLSLREPTQTQTPQGYNQMKSDSHWEQGIDGFLQKVHLAKQLRKHSREKIYTCEVCQKTFPYKISLTKHLRTHSGEKIYTCEVCHKRFPYKISLTKHLKTHSGERPYSCDVCQKKFSIKCNLTQHLAIHSAEKPYACNICQKRFSQNSNLTKHLIIHSGEQRHTCNICQKRFSDKSNLSRHMMTHSGERRYTCNICQKRFSQNSNLTKHLIIHSGEKLYTCEICQKSFSTKSGLTRHMRTGGHIQERDLNI